MVSAMMCAFRDNLGFTHSMSQRVVPRPGGAFAVDILSPIPTHLLTTADEPTAKYVIAAVRENDPHIFTWSFSEYICVEFAHYALADPAGGIPSLLTYAARHYVEHGLPGKWPSPFDAPQSN